MLAFSFPFLAYLTDDRLSQVVSDGQTNPNLLNDSLDYRTSSKNERRSPHESRQTETPVITEAMIPTVVVGAKLAKNGLHLMIGLMTCFTARLENRYATISL